MTVQQKILVVSHDPHLADVRKDILELAGFEVLAAHNFKDVQEACKKKPDLVMIGYSLPPAEKRRVWVEVRENCNAPVLELHETQGPSLMADAFMADAFFHQAAAPDDFLSAVKRILQEAI
jgi:DNA-binding response OmpR family regulator